jgi:hypothetical protein
MTDTSIRAAYPKWPEYDRRLREVVASLTDAQLAALGIDRSRRLSARLLAVRRRG